MHKKPFHSDKKQASDKPFRKPLDRKEDKPFRKSSSGDKEERPFRKPAGNDGNRPFKKSFGKGEDHGFRKFSGNKEERPFKKPFTADGERPFKKAFDKDEERPAGKSYNRDGERPAKKSFGKEERPFRKTNAPGEKSFKKAPPKEEKRPNRYANAFGKLDDEELAAFQKKQKEKREQQEQEDEVTFSRELNKWEEKTEERSFGKSDVKPGRKTAQPAEGAERKRNRHDASSRFKKQFDDENPYEQAYESKPGKKEEGMNRAEHLEGQPMPLNKFIAHCDVCSRRDAVNLIKEGKVTVNGTLVIEPGFKVTTEDEVTLNGNKLTIQKNLVYILMNKPKGFITTTDDPKGRRTVMELVENVIEERVFPVGRLDRNTTGLLLLTNDGELTQKLAHPKYNVRKVYKATLDKNLSKADFDKIKEGVILEDGKADVDQLEYLDTKNEIGLEIHSGKNRIVRRIFESLGYEVEKLDRVMYAGLTKKNILRGKWRFLTKQEVINLKHLH